MLRAVRVLASVLIIMAPVILPQQPGEPSANAAPTAGLNAGYPRLANYNGFTSAAQVPFFSAYNLIVARRDAPIGLLKAANPHVITLLYERTLQTDLCCTGSLYGLEPRQMPPQWWLVGAGSRLPMEIGPDQDWIPVADPRPFAPCQDILVDGESMHIWGVEGRWLHVLRGYYSTATAHAAGARVAPHISYRADLPNCQIDGTNAKLRPWSLNLSSYCPRWHGMSWVDFLARRMADLVKSGGWSGVFYDNMDDLPFSPLADTNNDGRADGGIVNGVNAWRDGERQLLAETSALLPHHPLLVNGDLQIARRADGREMENFPVIPGLALSGAIDTYLAGGEAGTPLTMVNPDTQDRALPDPGVAQLDVGISLLGDGYAAYDRGWMNHGDGWWFDAYDNGAGTALQDVIGPWTASVRVAHPWRFRRGDVVLMDQEAALVTAVTPHTLVLQRGLYGTVAVAHAAGTSVTTAWQRVQGHGYLGLPRGAARLVPTDSWQQYALPLAMSRREEQGSPRHHRFAVHQLGATNSISISAGLHYDGNAAGINLYPPHDGPILRTLTFQARGPAGATLWVTAGKTLARLVLRAQWHQYTLPVVDSSLIVVGTGRAGGEVGLQNVRLYGTQAFVLRRDFTHGIVLVNPTDRVQPVRLEHPYLLPPSDQQGRPEAGKPTCRVILDHYQAAILLTANAHAHC